MQYIIYALIAIAIYFIFLGAMVTKMVVYPKKRTMDDLERDFKLYLDNKQWYNHLEKEQLFIQSEFGYGINTTFIENPDKTDNTIIVCHGVTMLHEGVSHYIRMFMELGYNVVAIDHRAHGKSGGKTVSYGYYEKHDLAKVIDWTRDKTKGKIGLFGESMGAGISMQTLAIRDVDFIIEDCGYSSFDEQIKHQLRTKKYAPLYPVYSIARLFIKIVGKYDLNEISPQKAMSETKIPVMIIHGDKDNYVPFYMADILYNSLKTEHKMKYYAKDSRHACSYYDYPEEYKQKVVEFLRMADLPCKA